MSDAIETGSVSVFESDRWVASILDGRDGAIDPTDPANTGYGDVQADELFTSLMEIHRPERALTTLDCALTGPRLSAVCDCRYSSD